MNKLDKVAAWIRREVIFQYWMLQRSPNAQAFRDTPLEKIWAVSRHKASWRKKARAVMKLVDAHTLKVVLSDRILPCPYCHELLHIKLHKTRIRGDLSGTGSSVKEKD